MKKAIGVAVFLFAWTVSAETIFTIGPRVSSYSTNLDAGITRVHTGRQTSVGAVAEIRSGKLDFDFNYDHDPNKAFTVSDVIVQTAKYQRDRGEALVGLALTPNFDIQGGFHYDDFRLGGPSFFGNPLFSDLRVKQEAVAAGVKFHRGDAEPIGFYGFGRAYYGRADYSIAGPGVRNPDTAGFRAEGGITFRLGRANWYLVPAFEYERLKTSDDIVDLKTNRALLSFVYRSH